LTMTSDSIMRYCTQIWFNNVKEWCLAHKLDEKHEEWLKNGWIKVIRK
jgi:hypothetical protein